MLIYKNTNTIDGYLDWAEIITDKEKAEVLLLGSKSVQLSDYPKLKGVFRVGVSKTNVPIQDAKKRNIKVCFPSSKTKNYIYEETANFTCGAIFKKNYANLGTLNPWFKKNRRALSTKELLIIGDGKIGKKVREKMSIFLNVSVFDPYKFPDKDLSLMLPNADFVSIHIPDTSENIGFFDKQKLSFMKKESTLINTARGRIVDENALYDELVSKRISAVFDVYWKEPYHGKLKKIDSEYFTMTPHVASTCDEFLIGSNSDLKSFVKKLNLKP